MSTDSGALTPDTDSPLGPAWGMTVHALDKASDDSPSLDAAIRSADDALPAKEQEWQAPVWLVELEGAVLPKSRSHRAVIAAGVFMDVLDSDPEQIERRYQDVSCPACPTCGRTAYRPLNIDDQDRVGYTPPDPHAVMPMPNNVETWLVPCGHRLTEEVRWSQRSIVVSSGGPIEEAGA